MSKQSHVSVVVHTHIPNIIVLLSWADQYTRWMIRKFHLPYPMGACEHFLLLDTRQAINQINGSFLRCWNGMISIPWEFNVGDAAIIQYDGAHRQVHDLKLALHGLYVCTTMRSFRLCGAFSTYKELMITTSVVATILQYIVNNGINGCVMNYNII